MSLKIFFYQETIAVSNCLVIFVIVFLFAVRNNQKSFL
jgi:hypothetical protein